MTENCRNYRIIELIIDKQHHLFPLWKQLKASDVIKAAVVTPKTMDRYLKSRRGKRFLENQGVSIKRDNIF